VQRDPGASLRDVEARLGRLHTLSGTAWRAEPLAGGLTNLNFTVSTGSGRYVARLAGQTGSLLAIDRDAEHRNAVAAASTGVAPAVVEYAPAEQVLLIDWVPGRTLGDADLKDQAMLARVAGACRTLHAGPRFVTDFDMFAVQQRYLRIVQEHGFRLPARYADFEPAVRRISWTPGTGSGWSTSSTRGTTRPASSWATSGARRACRRSTWRRWWRRTTAARCGTRWPGRDCSG
jgi:hypothetical protein